jgi:hypothetical protein
MNARRLTDCTYLAQTQIERLQAVDWTGSSVPSSLTDGGMTDTDYDLWSPLEWTSGSAVNAANTTDPTLGPLMYTVSWDITSMDASATWVRLRVRCTFEDPSLGFYHGTTISSYRFRDS